MQEEIDIYWLELEKLWHDWWYHQHYRWTVLGDEAAERRFDAETARLEAEYNKLKEAGQ